MRRVLAGRIHGQIHPRRRKRAQWLQRRSGTRKATAEALRDHFKAKQWPVPIRPDGRNGDQFVPWLHPDVAWANLETGDVREMYKADRAKAKEAARKRRRRRKR